jgi:hypothetical protein
VVPAWAAVAIALGGSFITAVSSVVVGLVVAKRQAVGEWRQVFLDAAEEFSTAVAQALRTVRETIRCVNEEQGSTPDRHERVAEVMRLIAEADDRLAHVQLLFGQDTEPGKAASDAIEDLRRAADGLRRYVAGLESGLEEANEAVQQAQTRYRAFSGSAAPTLPGWPYARLGVFRTGNRR